jgi:hypothetical protein
MKSKDTQRRKGTWVPPFSNGRLLRPSKLSLLYNEKMKNVGERTPSLFTQVRGE